MINTTKMLLITEGETDSKLFDKIKSSFNINIEIVYIKANIYKIYNKMEREDFNCNVKDIVLECLPNDLKESEKLEYKNKLKDTYAYIYFVFDFDPQHHEPNKSTNIIENCTKIEKMLKELDNETDDTRGKLYINYPMMQSFRDIDSFNDPNFISSCISINELENYKSIVSLRKIHGKSISSYTVDNFVSIFYLNARKILSINNIDITIENEHVFFDIIKGINIYYKIKGKIDQEFKIYILNSSIFFLSEFKNFNEIYVHALFNGGI